MYLYFFLLWASRVLPKSSILWMVNINHVEWYGVVTRCSIEQTSFIYWVWRVCKLWHSLTTLAIMRYDGYDYCESWLICFFKVDYKGGGAINIIGLVIIFRRTQVKTPLNCSNSHPSLFIFTTASDYALWNWLGFCSHNFYYKMFSLLLNTT